MAPRREKNPVEWRSEWAVLGDGTGEAAARPWGASGGHSKGERFPCLSCGAVFHPIIQVKYCLFKPFSR